jgi:hypothetical protein
MLDPWLSGFIEPLAIKRTAGLRVVVVSVARD